MEINFFKNIQVKSLFLEKEKSPYGKKEIKREKGGGRGKGGLKEEKMETESPCLLHPLILIADN